MKQDGKWGWWIGLSLAFAFALLSSSLRCFSVFYQPLMTEFNVEYESVSILVALFQIGYGLSCALAPILFKYLTHRKVVMGAAVVSSFFIFLASFAKALWQVQVGCGLISGICLGGIVVGTSTSVARYFCKYRLLAMQIGSFGSSLGGLAFCPLYQYFINTYAWRGAWQLVAGVFLNSTVLGAFLRPIDLSVEEGKTAIEKLRLEETKSEIPLQSFNNEMIDESTHTVEITLKTGQKKPNCVKNICKKWDLDLLISFDFYLYSFVWITFTIGFYIVPGYLVPFGKSIGFDSIDASALPSSFATGEIISRILHAFVFTKLPKRFYYRVAAAAQAVAAIFYFALPFTVNYWAVSLLCSFIGLCVGGLDALLCLIIVELFDLDKYAASFGFSGVLTYIAGTGTTILIGKAIDLSESVATSLWIGGGAFVLSSCLTFFLDLRVQQINSKRISSLQQQPHN